jgi:hypothetical protein
MSRRRIRELVPDRWSRSASSPFARSASSPFAKLAIAATQRAVARLEALCIALVLTAVERSPALRVGGTGIPAARDRVFTLAGPWLAARKTHGQDPRRSQHPYWGNRTRLGASHAETSRHTTDARFWS